ncbi:MAG TPA: single-stranded DNA-binding protein [Armatimonadota bacterium]|jgi:single-strand DNA-binding protein
MINRVVLVGRLTRDPELRYTPSGAAVCTIGIALDDPYRKDDQGQFLPNFFNVVAWDKRAEYAANYLTKGNKVGVDGRLQYRSWVDQNGQKRSTVEIVAERLQGLESRRDSEGGAQPAGATPSAGTSDLGPEDYHDPFADE